MAGSGGDDLKFCANCKREIAAVNFVMHEVHCRRNIVLCSICDEPIPRSEMDDHIAEEHTHCPECDKQVRPADLPAHVENEHGSQVCPNCNEEVPNNNFENHSQIECLQRKVPCSICELELPIVEMAEHEQWCGSRTELCTMCQRYVKLKDLDLHISSSCQLPEVEKKEKTPLSSDQDLAQRMKAYEFRREELNRALGLDGNWKSIPPTLRHDSEYTGVMARFQPDQEEVVEAGNQMLRIEQMAEAMMSGQGDGFLDRYNRRREMFGESEEEPEDVLSRARRRRRMNEEAAAAAAAADGGGSGSGSAPADQTGRKTRTLEEIRKERMAKEPDPEETRPSRFLWVGGGRSEEPEAPPPVQHRLARTGVALPGFDHLKKENSKPKDKSPKPKPRATPPSTFEDTIKIPCEFCMTQFPIEQLMDHQEQCGPNAVRNVDDELPSDFLDNLLGTSRRRSPNRATATASATASATGSATGNASASSASLDFPVAEAQPPGGDDALPCEFCEDLFPFDVLIQHQSGCDKNPSRPTSSRQNALAKLNEKKPDISSSQPVATSKPSPGYTASLLSDVRRPSRAARETTGASGSSSSGSASSARQTSNHERSSNLAEKYGLGQAFVTEKLVNPTKKESRHRKSREKDEESMDEVKRTAQMTRDRLVRTSGKILGKQAQIDLSGDTNARYHAMMPPSVPRAATDESNATFAGGAAAETPSAAYGDEASDRYLSHRERMITATRERMGDAAASSRSENWASQILDNLLDEESENTRVKRGGSRDRPTPPPANGGARQRNGAASRPSGFNSPSSKYVPKK